MTKAEAKAMLKRIQEPEAWEPQINQVAFEALDMAIEALSQESSEDVISRQALMKEFSDFVRASNNSDFAQTPTWNDAVSLVGSMPPAQPEIVRCKDCIYYDPPHVENNGVRYEYDEMQADAFDALGTGLVNAEYGINIGGRCCVDYYCKNYSDDKRVFVREDNYCGRAERRTDGSD